MGILGKDYNLSLFFWTKAFLAAAMAAIFWQYIIGFRK